MLQQIEVSNFESAPNPLKLICGGRNPLRFMVQAPEIDPANLVRKYAAITRLGHLLTLGVKNMTVTAQDGALAIDLVDLDLNTAEIQNFILDNRQSPDIPDETGEFTFCRANLEIALFDRFNTEEASILINIPVEIYQRQYISCDFASAVPELYYPKTEIDSRIAAAIVAAEPIRRSEFENVFGDFASAPSLV